MASDLDSSVEETDTGCLRCCSKQSRRSISIAVESTFTHASVHPDMVCILNDKVRDDLTILRILDERNE